MHHKWFRILLHKLIHIFKVANKYSSIKLHFKKCLRETLPPVTFFFTVVGFSLFFTDKNEKKLSKRITNCLYTPSLLHSTWWTLLYQFRQRSKLLVYTHVEALKSSVKSVERNNHFVWLLSTNQNRVESGREVVFITTGKILTFLNVSLRSWSPLREVAGCLGLSEPLLDLVINKLDKGIILK